MDYLKQQGLLFSYVNTFVQDAEKIGINCIDNLSFPHKNFFKNILDLYYLNDSINNTIFFCISSIKEKITEVYDQVVIETKKKPYLSTDNRVTIHTVCNFILNLQHPFTIIRIDNEELSHICFYLNNDDNSLDKFYNTFQKWLEKSGIFLAGKQVITNNFMLHDLNGRRIINILTDPLTSEKYFLIEGGLKLPLDNPTSYMREEVTNQNVNFYTLQQISKIITNPVYTFGIFFVPYELFHIWQQIFDYVLATSTINITDNKLKIIYSKFLSFISDTICDIWNAEPFIEKEVFFKSFKKQLGAIKSFLKGEDEPIISKDYLLTIKNYYMFIEPLRLLVNSIYPPKFITSNFDKNIYQDMLKLLDGKTAYEKGLRLENVMEYLFLNCSDFQVMAKRIKNTREEIDLCCVNISSDSDLWNLGAFIYVECKNWHHKVGINIIRELGYIMFYKGNTTTILVARNGVTAKGQNEIQKQAISGKYILVFNLTDLKAIDSSKKFISMIIEKYNNLEKEISNNLELIGA